MFSRTSPRGAARDEAEKPFWISFADLMTALMILFLVVLVVALVAVKSQEDRLKQERKDLDRLAASVANLRAQKKENDDLRARRRDFLRIIDSQLPSYISIDPNVDSNPTIDWGSQITFAKGQWAIDPDKQAQLRRDIRTLLTLATSPDGSKLVKRFVLEGFASPDGNYLSNLNLSLMRAESVMCALLDNSSGAANAFAPTDRNRIARLFLIGGYSSNDTVKETTSQAVDDEASRRVELKLEWRSSTNRDSVPLSADLPGGIGSCSIGG